MYMTIQDWGAVGELVGAVAVIATLIYLSVQLRQAADSVRSSVAAVGSGYATQVWQLPIDKPDLAEMIIRGNQGVQELSDEEFFRYQLFLGTVFRGFEQYFILHELGSLSDAQWQGWELPLRQATQEPGVRQIWAQIRGQHDPEFTKLVDGLIDNFAEADTSGLIFSRPT
jgi:hypothetical protein